MSNSKDCKEVFTDIYARKVWGDGSGGGSGEQAMPYCAFISNLLANDCAVYEVLDIGSGDQNVTRNIKWHGVVYYGIDAAWGHDALTDTLPPADLVLCKEVMQHLSNEQVQTLLDRTAHYPRRLFTNNCDPEHMNEDIETGGFRPVDLSKPPFNQPCKTVFTYGHWHIQEL